MEDAPKFVGASSRGKIRTHLQKGNNMSDRKKAVYIRGQLMTYSDDDPSYYQAIKNETAVVPAGDVDISELSPTIPTCPYCHHAISAEDSICGHCGSDIDSTPCRYCDRAVGAKSILIGYCEWCGGQIDSTHLG